MTVDVSEQPNFNPHDVPNFQAPFDWAMQIADDTKYADQPDRNLIIQLAIAVAHLTYKISELEDRLP